MTQVALGEICTFIGGGTPSRKCPEYFTGDIPWATVKDFKSLRIDDTEEHVTSQAIDESAANIVEPGTVLLVTRVGLGKVAIAGARLAINQDIKAVISNDSVIPEFLFWFLMSQSARIQAMGTGATVKGVTLHDVRAISMPLPPLPEQRRIVDLLSRAEGIVRLRREAQRKAAELVPALFVDMFGDPASNPKGWPTTTFGDAIRVSSGTFLPAKAMDNSGEFAVYGGNGLSGRHNEYMFESPQIIIGRVGEHCGNVHLTEPNCWITDNALYVRGIPELFDLDFLLWHLKIARLNQYASRAGQPLISAGRIASVHMVVPPIHLQRQFSSKADAVRGIAAQQTAALATAQATFDALLYQSFQH